MQSLTEALTHRCSHSQMQSLTDAVTHRYSHSQMQSLTDAVTHRCSHSQMQSLTDAATHRCSHSQMQPLTDAVTHRCSHSQMQSLTDAATHRCTLVFLLLTWEEHEGRNHIKAFRTMPSQQSMDPVRTLPIWDIDAPELDQVCQREQHTHFQEQTSSEHHVRQFLCSQGGGLLWERLISLCCPIFSLAKRGCC